MKPKTKNGGYRRVPVTVLILALIVAVAAPSLAFTGLLLLQADNVNRASMGLRAAQGARVQPRGAAEAAAGGYLAEIEARYPPVGR